MIYHQKLRDLKGEIEFLENLNRNFGFSYYSCSFIHKAVSECLRHLQAFKDELDKSKPDKLMLMFNFSAFEKSKDTLLEADRRILKSAKLVYDRISEADHICEDLYAMMVA